MEKGIKCASYIGGTGNDLAETDTHFNKISCSFSQYEMKLLVL